MPLWRELLCPGQGWQVRGLPVAGKFAAGTAVEQLRGWQSRVAFC